MFQGLIRLVSQLCLHSANWQPGSLSTQLQENRGLIDQFLPNHSTPSCRSLGLDLSHVPKDVGSQPSKILNKKAEANGIQSTKYYILTGRHRDEELSSTTLIRGPPSVSCYRQNQHLQKSEAYNTRIYNFSAERSQYLVRRSKMVNYKVLNMVSKTSTQAFSGGFCAKKSVGSVKDLSKLSSTLHHLLITSD